MLTVRRMASLPSAAAAATATATTALGAAYAASLPPPPPPALPALPAQPTRAMLALSLLAARRLPVLRAGRTTNPRRPANLEAELGQFTSHVLASKCTHCASGAGV